MKIKGNIVDLHNRSIYYGCVEVSDGKIVKISKEQGHSLNYILPGFVDAHVHVESSMLIPSEFARLAVVHGTVATISDPHEIANVMGTDGVHYMINNGKEVPFKFNFGAPSCVPATSFETAGAVISVEDVKALLEKEEIKYLTEMMNYPGVLFEDEEVMAKLAAAKAVGKVIDGHAPGLRGDKAKKYIAAGISTDHECFSYEEALEKLELGLAYILIREGSAAKNFDALIDLLPKYPERIMFCSDDKHPDDLILGHINQLAARARAKGCELFDVLRAACLHPVLHYGLDVGLLREGDPADFIIVDDLRSFKVKATYINGQLVAKKGSSLIPSVAANTINNFRASLKSVQDFALSPLSEKIKVIRAIDGELITESFAAKALVQNGNTVSDTGRDILKMCVVNRYEDVAPAIAFIQGFGLESGAIASCVAHDSHNIIAVGTDDESLCRAVNLIIENKGGVSAVGREKDLVLPLPVAGIMTTEDGYEVAKKYARIDAFVKKHLHSPLRAPFMTLSFMALLVIPQLKLSDKGLFDGNTFAFVDLF
ncbi:MAG TPA: adenine deaminase, partial [Phaeodactylibacter sp.]|nr:adenine deaminase [Phaeodactylibacter sp.]